MKKLMMQIGLMIGLMVILAVVSATAQRAARYRAEIPFDFNIGQKTCQAGDYFISADAATVTLEDKQGNYLLVKIVAPGDGANSNKLFFNRYADQYFLATIVLPAAKAKLPPSNAEKQLAKNRNSPIKTISVNMRTANK